MDEVDVAAGARYIPYDGNTPTTVREVDGRNVAAQIGEATDALIDVMRLQVVHGRRVEPAGFAQMQQVCQQALDTETQ